MAPSTSKLFEPIQVGNVTLAHRVAFAPCTRMRATPAHVPGPLTAEYYAQRASVPGTMLITEATFIAAQAGLYPNIPGIYNDAQIAAWKEVTDAVHARGSFIYVQLWALGRAAVPEQLRAEDTPFPYVSASNVRLTGKDEDPRPLTEPEIREYLQLYATAASNAVHKAGFDGVEIHGANGYLVDQFTQDVSNTRTDAYGGSIENRCRFSVEVVDAVAKAIGADKTGIRLSPWSEFQDMGMADPVPTFSHLVSRLRDQHTDLAFIHVVEPRISGGSDNDKPKYPDGVSNDFIRKIWGPRPLLSAGGVITPEIALERAKTGDIIAVGRYFISNPDLPARIKKGIPWTPYNRATFYLPGAEGYIDYPFADEAANVKL